MLLLLKLVRVSKVDPLMPEDADYFLGYNTSLARKNTRPAICEIYQRAVLMCDALANRLFTLLPAPIIWKSCRPILLLVMLQLGG